MKKKKLSRGKQGKQFREDKLWGKALGIDMGLRHGTGFHINSPNKIYKWKITDEMSPK